MRNCKRGEEKFGLTEQAACVVGFWYTEQQLQMDSL